MTAVCVTPLQFLVIMGRALLVIGCAILMTLYDDLRNP
jgi:hypothetical protein